MTLNSFLIFQVLVFSPPLNVLCIMCNPHFPRSNKFLPTSASNLASFIFASSNVSMHDFKLLQTSLVDNFPINEQSKYLVQHDF